MIATRLRAQASIERARWLPRCVGFRVDGPDGPLGVVAGVRREPGGERLLVVRSRLGRRRREVPAHEILDIMGARRRVVVGSAPGQPSSGSRAVKVLPSPGSLSAVSDPPIVSTSSRAMARPSPAPPESRLRANSSPPRSTCVAMRGMAREPTRVLARAAAAAVRRKIRDVPHAKAVTEDEDDGG